MHSPNTVAISLGGGETNEVSEPLRRCKRTVTLLGETPSPTSSTATLDRALRRSGIESRVDRPISLRNRSLGSRWDSDIYVVITYRRLPVGKVLKLAYGILRGRPVIRWWVGTDVLRCVEDPDEAWFAQRLDRLVSANLAVSPLLREELATVDLKASVIPLLDPDKLNATPSAGPLPKVILAYVPTKRSAFYGEEVVRHALTSHPEIPFLIVGCEDRDRFREFPNAENLGVVYDMAPVYARTGCLLRVTRHDGLPRMVLESLLQEKYVIFSQPLPSCWLAVDSDQVEAQILRFLAVEAPNSRGRLEALRLLDPDPIQRFVEVIEQACLPVPLRDRIRRAEETIQFCTLLLARELRDRLERLVRPQAQPEAVDALCVRASPRIPDTRDPPDQSHRVELKVRSQLGSAPTLSDRA